MGCNAATHTDREGDAAGRATEHAAHSTRHTAMHTGDIQTHVQVRHPSQCVYTTQVKSDAQTLTGSRGRERECSTPTPETTTTTSSTTTTTTTAATAATEVGNLAAALTAAAAHAAALVLLMLPLRVWAMVGGCVVGVVC